MKKKCEAIDGHVGERIRALRNLRGKSQTDTGDALGITFQQVQKQEKGINRVSASALYRLAKYLEVDPSYFFEGLDISKPKPIPQPQPESLEVAFMLDGLIQPYRLLLTSCVKHMVKEFAAKGAAG